MIAVEELRQGTDPEHSAYLGRVQEGLEMTGLMERKQWDRASWVGYLGRIGREDLAFQWNDKKRMMYTSAEYYLPGLGAAGGLGALSRDHFLQAVENNQPGLFIGLGYETRKEQRIRNDGVGNFWQEDPDRHLPSSDELGMEKVNVDVRVQGEWGESKIDVHKYVIGTNATELMLLKVNGEVYPGENNSNARLWHNTVLGFGGYQVSKQLREQGAIEEPPFYHLNESATVLSALACLDDKTGQKEAEGAQHSFADALNDVRDRTILTNHTLVPAAEATFTREQCDKFIFSNLTNPQVKEWLGQFIDAHGGQLMFRDLAFALSGRMNGVSQLHADIANVAFPKEYQGDRLAKVGKSKIEFSPVTNGIHEQSWNRRMHTFLTESGVIDRHGLLARDFVDRIDGIDPQDLWHMKQEATERFADYMAKGRKKDHLGRIPVVSPDDVLVGSMRRAAMYKRQDMIFRDEGALDALLAENPNVKIFIAGKAHPADHDAKGRLSYVAARAAHQKLDGRVSYLADYDTELMAYFGPACRVWVNNPIVGQEACGTSGMKTGFGGALQVSTRDGFYPEIADTAYYRVTGATDQPDELHSFTTQMRNAVLDAQDPERYAQSVKQMWKEGMLHIAGGARMLEGYANLGMPKGPVTLYEAAD